LTQRNLYPEKSNFLCHEQPFPREKHPQNVERTVLRQLEQELLGNLVQARRKNFRKKLQNLESTSPKTQKVGIFNLSDQKMTFIPIKSYQISKSGH
jgi:hypothetical protein